MAKSKSSSATSGGPRNENAVMKYINETRAELRKVTWPTPEETRSLTTIILIVTLAMAIFLGTLDFAFQQVSAGVIGIEIIWIIVAVALFAAGAAAFYFNGQEE